MKTIFILFVIMYGQPQGLSVHDTIEDCQFNKDIMAQSGFNPDVMSCKEYEAVE